jgi:general secretion pathway protein C
VSAIPRALLRRALPALAAALAVWVAWAAGGATWRALGHFSGAAEPPAPASGRTAAAPVDLEPILRLAPFGVAAPAAAAPGAASQALSLRGVIVAVPASASTALIADAGGQPRAYAVGESLPGGATLESVAADHVVLNAGGRRERLDFPEAAALAPGAAAVRASIPGFGPAAGGSTAEAPAQPEEAIDFWRRRIAEDPRAVLGELGLAAGDGGGYRIGEGAPPQVRRAGLLPGDVVVRVNGVPVGDVEADRLHFETVAAAGRARVEVMRDGRLMILTFPLR